MLKRLSPWLLGLLLAGSLVTNLLLARWARDYYLALNRVNLDPVGLGYYANTELNAKSTERKRILFYGDSRAFAWPVPDAFAAYEVINRGVGGQTTAQILARFEQDVLQLEPDVVVIQAGINDLKTVGLFHEQRAEIIANCQSNIAAMVQRSQSMNAVVLLTTIFPTAQPSLVRRPFWSDDIAVAVEEVNAYLRSLAGEQVMIFDSWAVLAGSNNTIQPQYGHDLLHLNDRGYAALNRQLESLQIFHESGSNR